MAKGTATLTRRAAVDALSLAPEEDAPVRHRGLWGDALRRLARHRPALVGAVVIVVVGVLAAFAPLIDRYSPSEQDLTASFAGPGARHWLGTDQLGRDLYSRLINGARIALSVGVLTQVVTVTLGLTLGLAAGLGLRWLDQLLMRLTDVVYAFPALLFIILLISVGPNWPLPGGEVGRDAAATLLVMVIAIGVVSWPDIARLVRGQILSLREREFVLAAEALGASRLRIVLVHLLPNTLGPVIVAATFGVPAAIFAEAALSFIGLGLPPPTPSWGRLISDGYAAINAHPNLVLAPALAISTLMMAFTFLGDGLRDALDPRAK